MKKYNKIFITTAIVAIIAVVLLFLSKNPVICEFFTQNVYKNYAVIMSKISSVFPFSLFEVIAAVLVALLLIIIVLIILDLKNKNKDRALVKTSTVLLVISIIFCSYSLLVSFMYNREKVPVEKEEILLEKEVVKEYSIKFLNEFNNLATKMETRDNLTISKLDEKELLKKLEKEFFAYFSDSYYIKSNAKVKKIISSKLMSAFGITGITYVPLVEANVNGEVPLLDKIFTSAHELAHSTGVMKENEANLMAYSFLLNSDYDLFRYAGYINTLNQVIDLFVLTNNANYYNNFEYNEIIINDIKYINKYWDENATLTHIGEFFNNLYLKSQGQSGVSSYRSYAEYTSYFDTELNTTIYVVKSYSDVQNVIFNHLSKI